VGPENVRQDGSAAKVLLVDGRAESRDLLTNALTIAGFEVAAAANGAFAVTMLEWECPDVIVSSAKVQDMDGYELYTLVRKDPTTLDTPFLLLAGRDRPTALVAAEAGVNMVLTGDVAPDEIVARVAELLKDGDGTGGHPIRRIESAGRRRAAEPLWTAIDKIGGRATPPSGRAPSLQGSLDVMDLAEVTQAIALGGKTGSLIVEFSVGEGSMLFEVGRLVHASFGARTGESAFAALIQVSQRESRAAFRFDQMERADLASSPKTISRSVDQLLLSIAAGIDEGGTGTEAAQTVAVTNQKEG
jgi:CheY-like chemotaxis protein